MKESIRAFYRLCVMVGTGIVLTLAWQAYGPSAEELGPILDRAKSVSSEWLASMASDADVNTPQPHSPPTFLSLTPLEAPPQFAPPATQPAPPLAESAPMRLAPPPTTVIARDALMSELRSLGMQSEQLTPWGSGGELYRFSCRMICPGQTIMLQHFEAVASEPAAAIADVLQQVKSHHQQLAGQF